MANQGSSSTRGNRKQTAQDAGFGVLTGQEELTAAAPHVERPTGSGELCGQEPERPSPHEPSQRVGIVDLEDEAPPVRHQPAAAVPEGDLHIAVDVEHRSTARRSPSCGSEAFRSAATWRRAHCRSRPAAP